MALRIYEIISNHKKKFGWRFAICLESFLAGCKDSRLNRLNTKARKIEDYILGYGDDIKEENTSYLYMEFCKKEINQYITIGMGLRGKRGQPITFWGFLINDGRRIGKDFFL